MTGKMTEYNKFIYLRPIIKIHRLSVCLISRFNSNKYVWVFNVFQSLSRTDADHLKELMKDKIHRSTFSYDDLKRLMEYLMYKYDHDFEESKTADNATGRKYSLDLKQQLFKYPYKQLMIWSILMLR